MSKVKGCSIPEVKQSIEDNLRGLIKDNYPYVDLKENGELILTEKGKIKTPGAIKAINERLDKDLLDFVKVNISDNPAILNLNKWMQFTDKRDKFGGPIRKIQFFPTKVKELYEDKFQQEILEEIALENKNSLENQAREIIEEDFKRMGIEKDQWNDLSYDDLYNFDDTSKEEMAQVKGLYTQITTYKRSTIHKLEHRLNQVRNDKRYFKNDPVAYKALVKEEQFLVESLEGDVNKDIKGLKQELTEFERMPSIELFFMQAENDMVRLDNLMSRGNPDDIAEIRDMVQFYEAASTLRTDFDNPVLAYDEIFDKGGNIILPSAVISNLEKIGDKVKSYHNQIYSKDVDAIMATANSLEQVQKRPGELTKEEMFSPEGIKDTHWVDMYLMSSTNGIFSSNGMMPQVMQIVLKNAVNEAIVKSKRFEKSVDELQNKVAKKLPGIKGLGFTAVSYDIFRARNSKGQYRDGIAQRFTYEFYSFIADGKANLSLQMKNAMAQIDPAVKQRDILKAQNDRMRALRENTIAIDITKIASIAGNLFVDDGGKHEAELRNLLGDKGFEKEILKQKALYDEYLIKKETYIDSLMSYEGVVDEASLSPNAKYAIENFDLKNDPAIVAKNINEFQTFRSSKNALVFQSPNFVHLVPRKNKATRVFNEKTQDFEMVEGKELTNFYDPNFSAIEADADLEAFHNLLTEFSEEIIGSLPPNIKEKFSINSLPQMKKSLAEILVDPNLSALSKLVSLVKQMYDNIRDAFGQRVVNPFSQAPINVVTGRPDYQVNDEGLSGNRQAILDRYKVEESYLKSLLDIKFSENAGKVTIDLASTTDEVRAYMRTQLEPKVYQDLLKQGEVEIFKELKEAVTHQVISEQSFDLPKIVKFFSSTAMNFQARNKVLPILNIMKQHYENIKDVSKDSLGQNIINKATGKVRPDGVRSNGNSQMESWFNRSVLGNYDVHNSLGDMTMKENMAFQVGNYHKVINKRILSSEEKLEIKKIDDVIQTLREKRDSVKESDLDEFKAINKEINKLSAKREAIGKTFSYRKGIDAIFNWIRFLGLGFNVSSQVTNFLEGQTSNMISASSGKYFTPENIYVANNMIMSSFAKTASFGTLNTNNAKLIRVLMDRYDVLQDSSNELQKASAKSALGKLETFTNPYSLMSKTEYLNQAPLMLAILMDEKIKNVDGVESSVLDAMTPDGKLKPGFDTKENIENWEDAKGPKYNAFSSHLSKTIVDTHGDYDELRGNKASESIPLRAIFMFKRWLPRQIYNRFGIAQEDLETGQAVARGRYRDHTVPSGILQGALLGLAGVGILGTGPLGIVLGGVAGGVLSKTLGNQGQITSTLGLAQEMTFVIKEMMLNLMRMPVNGIMGKQVISEADYSKFKGKDEVAIQNLRANIMELSMILAQFGLMMVVKGLFWDDEEDEDDPGRMTHNYMVNTLMQMTGSLGNYSNPATLSETILSISAVTFIQNLGKFLTSLNDYVGGDDTVAAGPNAGKSATWINAKKVFVPSLFKVDDKFGFGAKLSRQFTASPSDKWFYGEEKESKNNLSKIKSRYKREIEALDLTEDEEEKLLKELTKKTKKKKKESYKETLERVERMEEEGNFEVYE